MKEETSFKKNFIWNTIGTSVNAFSSLFFMIIVTRVNGLDDAGIFTIAFSTACIVYMIGIYAGRVYQVTENNKKIKDIDYIYNRIISCIIASILCIIFVLVRGYDSYKIAIFLCLALYKSLEAFSEVLYGIVQRNNELDKVGKSQFSKAALSVISFTLFDIVTHSLLLSCLSIAAVFTIIIIFYDIRCVKKRSNLNEKVTKENIGSIFSGGFFTFAIALIGVYLTNSPKYAIDSYLQSDIQAIFGIIIMPATVMGLVSQCIIHPYLNKIFKLNESQDYKELQKLAYKIMLVIILTGILATGSAYLLGTQILGLIYGIDLSLYKIQLTAIIIGATFHTMASIISTILVTMRCTKIQFIIYVIIALVEMVLCDILVSRYELNGAIIGYLGVMIMYCVSFFITAISIISKKVKVLKLGGE